MHHPASQHGHFLALFQLPRRPSAQVVDVGGGTGFCTQGVVKAGIPPANITLIDQSPQQLAKARAKADLKGATILEVRPRSGLCWQQQFLWGGGWRCRSPHPHLLPGGCRAMLRTCPLRPTPLIDMCQRAA